MIKLVYPLIILLLCSAVFISGNSIKVNAQDTEIRAHTPKISNGFPREDSLPPQFINAAERLFELGFPDPRNCEYRQIEIKISNIWGNSSNVKIHGWLLPVKAEENRRLGIGWNGVIYSVTSIGEKQNVREDILDMLKFEHQRQAKQKQEGSESTDQLQRSLLRIFSASQHSLTPIKALLLLRLGEAELSAKVWNAAISYFGNDSSQAQIKDPFLRLASAWTWAIFDNALTAHMQGDNEQSRASARFLALVAEKIEAEAKNRGFKKPDTFEVTKNRYLVFMKPLPVLLADQERRATLSNGKAATVPQIIANPNKSARISALISKLDEVAARQQGQPGGVPLPEDPIIKALIDQGEAAVEPLLRVLETDERLTRSVRFRRDFFSERHIITAGEAAYAALTNILKTGTFVLPNDRLNIETVEGRRELAVRIKVFLNKYGRKTSRQRWYAVLADDKATAEEWNQAAAYIISPIGTYQISPSWVFTSASVPAQRRMNKIRLQGDSLHSENSPSVTELLKHRMFELAERKAENLPYQNLWIATNLSLALLTWDGRAQFSAVTSFQNILQSRLRVNANQPQEAAYLRTMMVRLYLKRIEAGDAAALSAYGEWISRMEPEEAGENTIELFKPMWRYASHPAMIAAVKRLFVRADSPWLPLIDGADRQSFFRAKLMESPLINVKSFRDLALAGLANQTVIGTWERRRTGSVESFYLPVENTFAAVLAGAINAGGIIISEKEQTINLSETARVRVCDAYAVALARLDNAPGFEISQTEKERDRAIVELKNFLSEGGKRFESAFNTY